jgi:DNA-binding MarR family transcriptional regulator
MPKQYYRLKDYDSRRSIGYLLRRSGKLITAHIEALFTKEDVSFVQWVILMNLRDKLNITAAELCQHLCHDSGALTRVIDHMEERGLIRRHRSKEDRRVITLQLTAKGRETTETFLPRIVQLYNGLLTDFTHGEINQLIDLLTRLIAKLSEPPNRGES